jgi:sulfite reductase (ferredoxin)
MPMFGDTVHEAAWTWVERTVGMADDNPRAALSDGQESQQPRSGDPFMVRCNIPSGCLTAGQYLLLDGVATRHMQGSLRITARYNLQLHGTLPGDRRDTIERLAVELRPLLRGGDAVGRPIMCCPAPVADSAHAAVRAVARRLSDHLLGSTVAAYEIWCGGEKIAESQGTGGWGSDAAGDARPSMHFKIGIAAPGDNCIDVYTHDLGLVPAVQGSVLAGFNVLVGGSMGMAPHRPDAFPRLAEPLAFVAPPQVLPVVDQIMAIEREAAARERRQHGRFKHLISAWGVERLRRELEGRLGTHLRYAVATPAAELNLHLGWHLQHDGRWYVGLSIENGRIHDQGSLRLRTGLREVVTRYRPGVCLTPNQDLLLTGLSAAQRVEVEARLRAYGIPWPDELSTVRRYAMACPARPSCGHAVAEAERLLPTIIGQLEAVIAQLGIADECLSIRMNGCSFGCTRPFVADLAFVGDAHDRYSVFLGGRADGTRVNWLFREQVPGEALVETVLPILVLFKHARMPDETLGDFCTRVGREALQGCRSQGGDESRPGC